MVVASTIYSKYSTCEFAQVPAQVKVVLRPVSKDGGSPLPWRVEPEEAIIPPHDSCYITVFFEPRAIQVLHSLTIADRALLEGRYVCLKC